MVPEMFLIEHKPVGIVRGKLAVNWTSWKYKTHTVHEWFTVVTFEVQEH